MKEIVKAYVGAQIHNGQVLLNDHVLGVTKNEHFSVLAKSDLPRQCAVTNLDGGLITPGFVDLQINGGGGVMFNDDPSVSTLRTIAQAHATTGAAALLPTLITDTPKHTKIALKAVEQAVAQNVPGIIGIHLEGPHLSTARKGAHDPSLIRKMTDTDLNLILQAANKLPNVMVTVAPENTTLAQISLMSEAGVVVSLGHTDADFATCMAAFDAGARCVTHLFNAMSQMGNREPGLVGATLQRGDIYAGLIADGVHVHPAAIRIALAAKPKSDKIFLVTDSMATAGSQIDSFTLTGREVYRKNGRLTLTDGTLAGADLEMPQALSVMTKDVGEDIATAVRRATQIPAQLLGKAETLGSLTGACQSAVYFKSGFFDPVVLSAKLEL